MPPYVFAEINALKLAARHKNIDIVDLGFGNPDLSTPDIAVEKLAEAARNPKNHGYSVSRGIHNLRLAVADRYEEYFGVDVDCETEITMTIGAKEGFSHLMWTLLGPGDTALVPTPSYPIHIWGPILAGAGVHYVRLSDDADFNEEDFLNNIYTTFEETWPRPRVLILSFPHNPTTVSISRECIADVIAFAKKKDIIVVHDFAYADMGYGGYQPPSFLSIPGAKDVCVELYTLTKSFSMAGWRVGFMLGNAEIISALVKLKSYLDYGSFQPIQIAATVLLKEQPDYPKKMCSIYEGRAKFLVDGLNRLGWANEVGAGNVAMPSGSMFVWTRIPKKFEHLTSLEFSKLVLDKSKVAVSPGAGFGPGGEGHVRFALVENEKRISQAIQGLKELF